MAWPGLSQIQRRYGGKKKRRPSPAVAPTRGGGSSPAVAPTRGGGSSPDVAPPRGGGSVSPPASHGQLKGPRLGNKRYFVRTDIGARGDPSGDVRLVTRREHRRLVREGLEQLQNVGKGNRLELRNLGAPEAPPHVRLGAEGVEPSLAGLRALRSARTLEEQKKLSGALTREGERYQSDLKRFWERYGKEQTKKAKDAQEAQRNWLDDVTDYVGDKWEEGPAGEALDAARWVIRGGQDKNTIAKMDAAGFGQGNWGQGRQRKWLPDIAKRVGDAWKEGPGGEALSATGWVLRGGANKKTVTKMQAAGPGEAAERVFRAGWKGGLKGAGTAFAAIPTAQDLVKADNPDLAVALSLIDPTIVAGGGSALAKGAVRAKASMRELDRLGAGGILLQPKVKNLIMTSAATGDATRLAEVLARYERAARNLAVEGRTRGRDLLKSGTQQLAEMSEKTRAGGIQLRTKVDGDPELHALSSGPMNELSSEMMSLAAARRLERPGVSFGLKYPRALFQGKSPGILPGFRGLESFGVSGQIPWLGRVPLALPSPAFGATRPRKERLEFAQDLKRGEVQQQYAPQLEELSARIKAEPALALQLERQLETLQNKVNELAETAALSAEVGPRLEKVADVLARRTVQQQMRAAALHERSLQRAISGQITRMYHAAVRPLGRRPDPAALTRIKTHLSAKEADAVAQVDLLPLKSEAEELVVKQLRAVHDELLRQGQSAGFLGDTGRRGYVARNWEHQVAEGMDTVLDGMIRGGAGKGDFTRERDYGSVFERANRTRVAHELRVGWPELDEARSLELADDLWRTGAHRELARFATRAAQRARPWDVGTAETPALLRGGVRERSDVFQDPDRTDGVALLREDARDAFLPHIEDDAARLESLDEDLARANAQLGRTRGTEDQELIDTYIDVVARLNDEKLERDPRPTGAPDEPNLGGTLKDADYVALKDILSTIHPSLRDVRSGDKPITWEIVTQDPAGFVAGYDSGTHRIVLNKQRIEGDLKTPMANLTAFQGMQLRRALLHELAHARTSNVGGVFEAPGRVAKSSLVRYIELARNEGITNPELRKVRARELREEEVLETGSMRDIHRRTSEIRDRLLDDAAGIQWNQEAQQVLAGLSKQMTNPRYANQRKQQGDALFEASEGTARYFELMATDPENWKLAVGPELDDWLRNDVLRIQLGVEGVDLSPEALAFNDLIMGPDSTVWMVGKQERLADEGPLKLPEDNPAPHEVKARDDVWDPNGHLDQRGDKINVYPVIDPRSDAHWRANAQARAAAFSAHWRTLDRQYGRTSDARSLRPNGTDQWIDREGTVWIKPTILNGDQPLAPYIGKERVWPARVVQQVRIEALRLAPWEDIHKRTAGHMTERFLRQTRWSVTSPFPAYHIRNMMSDVLLSLQADPGVMFHPAAWAVSANALGAAAKGLVSTRGIQRSFDVNVPNVGKMAYEDFLFMSDALGIRSGENFADFSRILDKHPDLDAGFARAIFQRFQRGSLNFGTKREDIMRSATFVQAMRRNGGDAAAAAHTMIRHHFDYGDLSLFERQFMRNVFLFYTWYRKNIPLQLAEIWRRPGFFTTVAHNYEALEEGKHPIQYDYSRIAPFLPDLSGKPPAVAGLPEYLQERLGALPLSWNGEAAYIGFGAPFADLAMFSESGVKSWGSLLNPWLSTGFSVGSGVVTGGPGIDLLTGKKMREQETGALAELLEAIGVPLPQADGKPVLPWFVERVVGGLAPAASRGLSPIRPGEGSIFSLERGGSVLYGLSKTSYSLKERREQPAKAAYYWQREHLSKLDDIRGLDKPYRRQAARKVWTEAFDALEPKVQREVVEQMDPDQPGGDYRSYASRKQGVRLYTRRFEKGYAKRSAASRGSGGQPYVPGEGNPSLEGYDLSAPQGPSTITPKRNPSLEGYEF